MRLLILLLFICNIAYSQEFYQIEDLSYVLTDVYIDNSSGDYYYTLQQGYLLENGDTIAHYPTWNASEMGLLSVCKWRGEICVNVSGLDTAQHIICGADTILSISYNTSPWNKLHRAGELVPTNDKLYISTGMGAVFTDPQDTTNYRGKIISIDTNSNVKIEVLGLRNPWKFDYVEGKDLFFIGDVGWNDREEINMCQPVSNMGWPCYEGTLPHNMYSCDTTIQFPIYEYEHTQSGVSITGGQFYDDVFYFTDLYTGEGGALHPNGTIDTIQFPVQVTAMDIDSIMNSLIVVDFNGNVWSMSLDTLVLAIDSIPVKPKPVWTPPRIVPFGWYVDCDGYVILGTGVCHKDYDNPPLNTPMYDCRKFKKIIILN